ncbi:MAG: hypothetical protein R6V32_05495 [Bacteroidales bacterium]
MTKQFRYILIFAIILFASCNSNKDDYAIIQENTTAKHNTKVYETGRLVPADISENVRVPLIVGLINKSDEAQNWLHMETETYCESYGLLYLQPDYKQFPDVLNRKYIRYRDDEGKMHKLNVKNLTESYEEGFVLCKPDTTAVFMPWDSSSIHFDAAAAEAYFQFTYKDTVQDINPNYSAEDYKKMFPELKSTVNNKYDFENIIRQMKNRNVDFRFETGMKNRSIVEAFYTFKYLVEQDNMEMIAHNMIHYPLKVYSGDREIEIKKPKSFIQKADKIISGDLKNAIVEGTVFNIKADKSIFHLNDKDVSFDKKDNKIVVVAINIKQNDFN